MTPPEPVSLTHATLDRARQLWRSVTPVGRAVIGLAAACWLVGWRCGWHELMLIATGGIVLLLVCLVLTLGRTTLRVQLSVDPQRVTVGDPAAGQITVTNTAKRPLLPISLELPVGASALNFGLPTLRAGVPEEVVFVVPTRKRGVIPIGPATTVRGDPLGMLRRVATWTEQIELFVHPITVPLSPLGAGLLRDLEGQSSTDLSMSDLAFHALREYEPGDDVRHVHWRSSAKAGQLMVRQFLDTRRSHFTMVVDSRLASYRDEADFETAISAAASIAVRGARDEQAVTVVAGNQYASSTAGQLLLDGLARAQADGQDLQALASRAVRQSTDTSVAVLITGPEVGFAELRRATAAFPPEVRTIVMRIDPQHNTGLTSVQTLAILNLNSLAELRRLLDGALA